jgi:hypothetical protein
MGFRIDVRLIAGNGAELGLIWYEKEIRESTRGVSNYK